MECMRLSAGGTQIVRCREVVRSSECPLLEVPLYIRVYRTLSAYATSLRRQHSVNHAIT